MTKITIDRATVEQALEAFTRGCPPDCKDGMVDSGGIHPWGEPALVPCPACEAITALRQALEQPNEFHPDWDQLKPFNDRIAELESVAKQALEALRAMRRKERGDFDLCDDSIAALRSSLQNTSPSGESHEDSGKSCEEGQKPSAEPVALLTEDEKTELLDWVSACQSAYAMEQNPRGPFRPLPGQLKDNRQGVVDCINEILRSRTPAPPVIDKSAAIRIATALGWTPPRKPLTDEEIEDLYFDNFSIGELKAFARAIEAKLKEKNT